MSKIALSGNASGTGTLTFAAQNTNSNYTLTIPNETGTLLTSASSPTLSNLTLSGGVYIGGTGSANYLDDYEEGTWTPTNHTGGATITVNGAHYTKIGSVVIASAYVSIGTNSSTNSALIAGLPFAVKGGGSAHYSPSVFNYNVGSNEAILIRAQEATSTALIQTFQNNAQIWSRFSGSIGIFTLVYQTDA